jgi:gluconokinase
MVRHLVIMGVSGVGKSALGSRVAADLGYVFADADDFHPPANLAKMSRGEPLNDEDRAPWLGALSEWLSEQNAAGRSSVLACSALKRRYRDVLRNSTQNVIFVHLTTPRDVLLQRIRARSHFMPSTLLDSQLETLEPLAPDERGLTLDASDTLESAVANLLTRLRRD